MRTNENLSSCLTEGCEITLLETQREVSAYALPLPSVVQHPTLTFSVTTALQHCLNHLVTPLGACDRGGFPPMTVSLFYGFSFLISVLRLEIGYKKSAMLGGGCVGSGGNVSATAFTFAYSSGMSFCSMSQMVS